jgi:hypothetical protein
VAKCRCKMWIASLRKNQAKKESSVLREIFMTGIDIGLEDMWCEGVSRAGEKEGI